MEAFPTDHGARARVCVCVCVEMYVFFTEAEVDYPR